MNNIHILDCTLRDGGYCNEWRFGLNNMKKITSGLQEAGIEVIECGFITNRISYDPDVSKFVSLSDIAGVIPSNREGKLYVAMMNYGEFNVDDLPIYDGSSIDGIRVAFHKRNLNEALDVCRKIKEKGYLVFIQAMVSLNYSDEEFLSLIRSVNSFNPYAFYIVDSFGMMKGKALTRLFYMVEHNLNDNIWIGFHSHNNMQLAYSNAQQLVSVQTNRNLIIDSSIYGMGRGAGNLNTELFIEYLNENAGKNYNLKPILVLIDEILSGFYQMNYCGYSLPNYISAAHNAHPNYAGYLDDKKTLTIEGMNDIFDMMDEEKKVSFDKVYIEELYLKYMARGQTQEEHKNELIDLLRGKRVLLIAPGKSSVEESEKIIKFIDENTIVISINHVYEAVAPHYIFISNSRRFRDLPEDKRNSCIITSNITAEGVYYQEKYKELTNQEESVFDNAGLMAIKFFMRYNVEGIYLAGFDGYSHDAAENYGSSDLAFVTRNAILDAMNVGITKVLGIYKNSVKIEFLTSQKYVHI
ncbi:aldolase catalytic domain-containing protein [Ruminococcus flavefaciens]|uniref:4-hydroxy 2-oxovalerate aldolase n=1 Tax=Ruminococcus flavefaciens TaxID=1265 RepID=A0A1M7IBC3_RUMFL|nr:aldolase catalytic domain-containing protein [Ruminococcus flavefaciens]SHM37893.1 4-hydroxy 2-oxovalerate aldolase [Ruminococcus flavefaciens]